MINKNELDQAFIKSFEDFSDVPSDAVWAGLEQQLVASNKHVIRSRRYKYLFFITLGALFIISSLFLMENWNSNNKSSQLLKNEQYNQEKSKILKHQAEIAIAESTNNPKTTVNAASKIQSHSSTTKNVDHSVENIPSTYIQLPISKNDHDQYFMLEKAKTKSIMASNHSHKQIIKYSSYSLEESQKTEQSMLNSNLSDELELVSGNILVDQSFTNKIGSRDNMHLPICETLSSRDFSFLTTNEPDLAISKSFAPTTHIRIPKRSFLSRLSVSPIVSYSTTFRSLNGESNEIIFFNFNEQQSNSWSYGAKIDIDLKKSWSLATGFYIQDLNTVYDHSVLSKYIGNNQAEAMLFTSFNTNGILFDLKNNQYSYGDLFDINGVFNQRTQWLQIPLLFGYEYTRGSFSLNLSSGITSSFFLSDKLSFVNRQDIVTNFKHISSESSGQTHFSYRGEINVHFYSLQQLDLFVGIHYQRAFTNAIKNKSSKLYPYLYGVHFGLRKQLF